MQVTDYQCKCCESYDFDRFHVDYNPVCGICKTVVPNCDMEHFQSEIENEIETIYKTRNCS